MHSACIAVDAMGGDYAPEVVVDGVVQFMQNNKDIEVVLVGKERVLKRELKKFKAQNMANISIKDAAETVFMKENLFSYWKKRDNTSIKKCIDLLKDNKADAMFSSGHTGAVTALARAELGTLKNISRPALALTIPTIKGHTLLMDVGANVDAMPEHLAQSAIMGKVYLEKVLGINKPTVALMSVGEEDSKGNLLTKKTFNFLKSLDINFKGNIEGMNVCLGEVDLIVTDGFTGNVVLKVSEGVVDSVLFMLRNEIRSSLLTRLGFFIVKRSFRRVKRRFDFSETGGAILLGVDGIVVIGHGRSNATAIKSGIELTRDFILSKASEKFSEEILKFKSKFKEFVHV